jgi:hypothetical protein
MGREISRKAGLVDGRGGVKSGCLRRAGRWKRKTPVPREKDRRFEKGDAQRRVPFCWVVPELTGNEMAEGTDIGFIWFEVVD